MSRPPVDKLYERLQEIGKGAYGRVYKGRDLQSGQIVALKIIDLDIPDDDVAEIQREVALLTQLSGGPNITQYYGCHVDGPRVWIVMELAEGGSVFDLMKASPNGALEERFAAIITREVLAGLTYIHDSAVIHRDIKAANILVTAAGAVKICDFGVSAALPSANGKRNTVIGTPFWMAPEIAQSNPVYDTKADIWSMGILLYEMIKGKPPNAHIDRFEVFRMLPRMQPARFAESDGSKELREFLPLCLASSPADRLSAPELLKAKWVRSAKAPTAVLKELLTRYELWVKRGSRLPLGVDVEEMPHLQDNVQTAASAWEFGTSRRSLLGDPFHPLDAENHPEDKLETVRAPVKLPSSLRSLFDDGGGLARDPFRIPDIVNNPSTSPLVPIPPSPSGMSRLASKGWAKDSNVSHPIPIPSPSPSPSKAFPFPPRTNIQSRTRPKANVATFDKRTDVVTQGMYLGTHLSDGTQALDRMRTRERSNSNVDGKPRSPLGLRVDTGRARAISTSGTDRPSLPALETVKASLLATTKPPAKPEGNSKNETPRLSPSFTSPLTTPLTDFAKPRDFRFPPSVASPVRQNRSPSLAPRTHLPPSPIHPPVLTHAEGPVLRPLDYTLITSSREEMHAELATIVEDLSRWLALVETGLSHMAKGANDDRVDEQDESGVLADSLGVHG
ncbi:Pkinase-domain-containing protein [Artomyces pyxidatus]|uniref:Pkinase-domain-containing protein n=1 Tax=Artomyces pyxidatus TaxID=48021 RepID=A0ACB8TFG1_9AGAM|nr:Pkinase-domain-containing protein [Artomyces pyxidatus]